MSKYREIIQQRSGSQRSSEKMMNMYWHSVPDKKELFNYKSEFILNASNLYPNQEYKKLTLKEYLEFIFCRNNNKELPFESFYGESDVIGEHKYNAIVTQFLEKRKTKNIVLTSSLGELSEITESDFAIMAPITYVGKSKRASNGRLLYAFCVDLDYVAYQQIRDVLHQININFIPAPNIITNSGNGLHLYWVLKEPIELYQDRHKFLSDFKNKIVDLVWNNYTSATRSKQFLSLWQGHRIPNTKTKLNTVVESFVNIKQDLWSLENLNGYLEEPYLEEELNRLKEKPKKKELQELYPDWYERRIVNKEPARFSVSNRKLYDWWLNKLRTGKEVTVGHRFFCCLSAVSFATKCGIPIEEVEKDLMKLVDDFDFKSTEDNNRFTEDDVKDSLRMYGSNKAHLFSREYISRITDIKIEANKRNGLSREDHLEKARFIVEFNRKKGLTKRKSSEQEIKIKDYLENMSLGNERINKTELAERLGVSKKTLNKYLNKYISKEITTNVRRKFKQQKITEYLKQNPNETNKSKIARELNIDRRTVYKYFKNKD